MALLTETWFMLAYCFYFLYLYIRAPNPFDLTFTILAFEQASRAPPMVASVLIA